MTRPAVFLDRDGTIIEDGGYVSDPADVHLLYHAPEGMSRMAEAGFALVVISNQSGIARGLLDESALTGVHDRLEDLLDENNVRLDGAYYCPYLDGPEAVVEAYRRDSDMRKPKPGMLHQAAREMDLDLSQSWMIGNSPADIAAGNAAGCRTILVSQAAVAPVFSPGPDFFVADLLEAAEVITKLQQDAPSVSAHNGDAGVERAEPDGEAALDGPGLESKKMAHTPQRPELDPQRSDRTSVSGSSRQSPAAESAPVGGRASSAPTESPEMIEVLRGIREQLDRAGRRSRQHDFSVLRLFGALLQMFAIVAGLWGLIALTGDHHDAAGARFALACLMQLASISAFAHDRLR